MQNKRVEKNSAKILLNFNYPYNTSVFLFLRVDFENFS